MKTKVGIDSNGWIIDGPAFNVYPPSGGEEKEVPDGVSIDESKINDPNKSGQALHWNGGSPEVRETGVDVPPEPDEAHVRLLDIARNEWGLTDSEMKTLRANNSLMFEYIKFHNYTDAKAQADLAYQDGEITSAQRDDVHDLLDGVK